MYTNVDLRCIDISVEDMSDVMKTLKDIELEIEDVKRKLSFQSVFSRHRTELDKTLTAIEGNKYGLYMLTQALKNISAAYYRSETSIDDYFERAFQRHKSVPTSVIDLSTLNGKINAILRR